MTGYGSEITRRRKEKLFDSRSYHSMTPMILNSIKYTDDKRYRNAIINRPLDVIKTIFLTILPEYGFVVREEQIKLSQNMYLGLTGKQVTIREAEVGAGKTLAYLIASFVAKERYTAEYGFSLPVTISTSSIELQKMIVEKEVPQLSRMLQDSGIVSILDSRAANGSYVPRVKMALLKYPIVTSVDEVKTFMKSVKGEDYYA